MILKVQSAVTALDLSRIFLLAICNLDLIVIALLDVQVFGTNQELSNAESTQGECIAKHIWTLSVNCDGVLAMALEPAQQMFNLLCPATMPAELPIVC